LSAEVYGGNDPTVCRSEYSGFPPEGSSLGAGPEAVTGASGASPE